MLIQYFLQLLCEWFAFIVHVIHACFCGAQTIPPCEASHSQRPSYTSPTPSCIGVRCVSWCDGSRAGVPAVLRGGEASKSALRGGLWACPSLGRTPGLKLKADVFGVHSLSYYCSIVIYKSVWDMEISHATQDMGWVKAHCETGPSTLWEGLICKLMLSLHLARTVYSMFSSFQHVIFSNRGAMSSLANGKSMPARQAIQAISLGG